MDNVKRWLESFGLNKKEIEVYLRIAEQKGSKVADIQRQTGYVRTTIYYCINQLISRGLISESIDNNIRTFSAHDAYVFRNRIEENIKAEQARLAQVHEVEEYLSSISAPYSTDSNIARYEGTRAIKLAIEAAMRCNSKTWHVLAARDNFLAHMSKTYQRYYLSERERRNITAKTLWEPIDNASAISLKDTAFRSPRRLPDSFAGAFNSLVIIYDNTVLIVDPYESRTAHAITSQPTATMLRLLCMALWETAQPA